MRRRGGGRAVHARRGEGPSRADDPPEGNAFPVPGVSSNGPRRAVRREGAGDDAEALPGSRHVHRRHLLGRGDVPPPGAVVFRGRRGIREPRRRHGEGVPEPLRHLRVAFDAHLPRQHRPHRALQPVLRGLLRGRQPEFVRTVVRTGGGDAPPSSRPAPGAGIRRPVHGRRAHAAPAISRYRGRSAENGVFPPPGGHQRHPVRRSGVRAKSAGCRAPLPVPADGRDDRRRLPEDPREGVAGHQAPGHRFRAEGGSRASSSSPRS